MSRRDEENVIFRELYEALTKARELVTEHQEALDGRIIDGVNEVVDALEQQILSIRRPTSVSDIRSYDHGLRAAGLVYLFDEYLSENAGAFESQHCLKEADLDTIRDFFWKGNGEILLRDQRIETLEDLLRWIVEHLWPMLPRPKSDSLVCKN